MNTNLAVSPTTQRWCSGRGFGPPLKGFEVSKTGQVAVLRACSNGMCARSPLEVAYSHLSFMIAETHKDEKLNRNGQANQVREDLIRVRARIKRAGNFQAGPRLATMLQFVRNGHGLTTTQVAKSAGISEDVYKKFELGTLNPTDQVIEKLAALLPELTAPALKFARDSEGGVPLMSEKAKGPSLSLSLEGIEEYIR